ncbi:MAG: hypothetical protein HYS26_03805 [Candidatus Kaiserbacteria bacterium]|nr:MAG: hypothetical protein HYS26_03805 [Candidatus Kaiserbacteria bacterium]
MVQSVRVALLTLLLASFVVFPYAASAQNVIPTLVECGNTGQPPCGICDLAKSAQNILNAGIYIAIFISAVLFAYAGWTYMTAGGEGGKTKGKEIFMNVFIGLALLLAAWLIVDTIMRVFTGAELGPWNKIC